MPDRFDDQINDFWNQVVSAGDATPSALDPRMADAIAQVNALSQSPISDSARERIRRKVLDQSVSTEGEPLVNLDAAAMPLPNPNGMAAPARTAPRRIAPARRPLTRMQWAMLAAAVLILLGAVGGFFASGGSLNNLFGGDTGNEPNPIPAATVESGWPQYRGGASRTGYSSDPGPGGDLDLRWTFTADEVMNNVISVNGTVYAYGRKGDLYALDALTGAQRWAVDLSAGEYSDLNRYPIPSVENGVLYTATFDGVVVALNARSGELVWQHTLASEAFMTSPAVADGVLFLGTPHDTVLALNPDTGETLWETTAGSGLQENAPAVGGGSVFVSDLGGDLIAISAADGSTQWTADLNEVNRVAAYRDGVVYVSGDDGMYRALDASNGNLLWTSAPQDEQALNPLVTPDALIAANPEGLLQALDLATGEPIWSVPGPGDSSSPHASSSAVYAVSPDLSAYVAYDLATGEELGRVAVDQWGTTAAIAGDTLVLSSIAEQGVVRSYGPGEGDPIEVTAGPAVVLPAATPLAQESATTAASTAFDGSQVQLVWQSTGDPAAPITAPHGLTVGPDGNLYLGDQALSGVQTFALDGAFLGSFGESGSGPGQFQAPTSIVFDNDGNRYVADLGNSRIQKFAPDGTFLLEWGSPGDANGEFVEPNFVAIDREAGRIYVSEFLNNRVQAFDLDGNFIDKWASQGSENGQFVHPAAIAVNADGLVFVGDTQNGTGGRVQIFDQYGTYKGELPDTFTEIWGLAFDAAGNLYVADYWANRIQVYDPNLVLIGTIENVEGAGPFEHPIGLAVDADGNLYVSDYDNQRLLKLQIPVAA